MENMTGVIPEGWRKIKKKRMRMGYERIRGKALMRDHKSKTRRSWRLKLPKIKIRLRLISPISLLAKVRDAYVRMMMSIAGKGSAPGLAYGFGPNYPKSAPSRRKEFFTEAEKLCLEYLKRDTNFLIAAAKAHADAQAHAKQVLGM